MKTMKPEDLRQWREEAELSQAGAAQLLEVPDRTYKRWEAGDAWPAGRLLEFATSRLRHKKYRA